MCDKAEICKNQNSDFKKIFEYLDHLLFFNVGFSTPFSFDVTASAQ